MGNRAFFLEQQIKKNNYTIGVEIGVQAGPTFKHLVESCPNLTLHGVDIWANKNVRWNGTTNQQLKDEPYINENYTQLLDWIENHGASNRTKLIRSFSWDAAELYHDNTLDFIFIDASHEYDEFVKDCNVWFSKVRPGGMVSGHDVHMVGVYNGLADLNVSYQRADDNVWWFIK